ncbi:hypothetical protein ADN00_02425 [Ornatilinea apprima]|uniref:Uncharacterized protein n=1 Tax=Ornatilinea apprima TaxID=1134406 RepID=A0A0P6XA77_9CHLR|nr:hypothetical protein ADN00_02425 [Ornatilinea apprima]
MGLILLSEEEVDAPPSFWAKGNEQARLVSRMTAKKTNREIGFFIFISTRFLVRFTQQPNQTEPSESGRAFCLFLQATSMEETCSGQ